MSKLKLADLTEAVAGSAAAYRLTLKLEAVSPKVFPPTYEGGKYATEERNIGGVRVPCVLLDSVASQANRMELALQEAYLGGLIEFPMVSVDFSHVKDLGIPKVTSLQAPHRIVDAILRDSLLNETKFRKSHVGLELDSLSMAHATPLLKYAPHCLVYGMWDSTGPRGGLGVKFARSVISEIIGVNAHAGKSTASRIDPLNIRVQSGVLYAAKDGGWSLDETLAIKDDKKKPKKLGKDGKPSEANHGNVTPSFPTAMDENKRPLKNNNGEIVFKGGFTIDYAEQTTVVSLPALRRLRFPAVTGGMSKPEADVAARVYLAAIGLLGATLAVEAGYDLRSRCVLHAKDAVVWQLLGKPGEGDKPFTLDKDGGIQLYKEALEGIQKVKLPIELKEIVLIPEAKLVTLVEESIKIAAVETGGE